MIFLDMDGTLLDSNSQIKEESKKILKKLKKDGKIIVIVTGRILSSAMRLLDSDFVDYVLSNNGARWYSYQTNEIIYERILDNSMLHQFFEQYKNYFERIDVATITWDHFSTVEELEEFLSNNPSVYQISAGLSNCDIFEMLEEFKQNCSQFQFQVMQDSFSEKQWLNILYKNINKGKSIVLFSKFLKQPLDSSICFGDGLNDIPMFDVCGIPVAMGNSLQKLKEKAGRGTFVALFLFVGVPLPGTGAWTGTLAASLLDMDFKSSILACMGGVLLAGVIMAVVSTGVFSAILALF